MNDVEKKLLGKWQATGDFSTITFQFNKDKTFTYDTLSKDYEGDATSKTEWKGSYSWFKASSDFGKNAIAVSLKYKERQFRNDRWSSWSELKTYYGSNVFYTGTYNGKQYFESTGGTRYYKV